jgi:hypothetical protein
MPGEIHRDDDQPELRLPSALADDLVRLYRPRIDVPAAVDEAVLNAARQRLAQVRRRRLVFRWATAGMATAAAVALAFWAVDRTGTPKASQSPVVQAVYTADYDQNGRIDILDAFGLARRIEAGDGVDRQWDVNGDGVVDRKDVDAIAMKAVSVSGGSV